MVAAGTSRDLEDSTDAAGSDSDDGGSESDSEDEDAREEDATEAQEKSHLGDQHDADEDAIAPADEATPEDDGEDAMDVDVVEADGDGHEGEFLGGGGA